MQKKNYKEMFLNFFKRYGYIVVLAIVMVALSVLLIVASNKPTIPSKEPVSNDPVTFYNPVMNFSVAKEFDGAGLVYNATLNQWEAHKQVSLSAGDNADVYAVLDGVVEDVYSNYLNGNVVVISHNGNLKTHYSSLDENVKVKKGETVKKGQIIGKVGTTANAELDLGTHLTFAITKNDVKVDPNAYLKLTDK